MKKISLLPFLIFMSTIVVSQNNKGIIFFDDFEVYNPGEQLACQNPNNWSTFAGWPCGPEDAYISDIYAYSGANSVNIVTENDNYYELNNYLTSGIVRVSVMIYIPSGNSAYYNILSDYWGGMPEWAFEIYFNTSGNGYLNAGGINAATFNFNSDTWLMSELFVDLYKDHAYYFIDSTLIYDWQWTLGFNGSGGQLQLAIVDFYGIEASSFYFDDFKIETDVILPPLFLPPTNLLLDWDNQDVHLSWESPAISTKAIINSLLESIGSKNLTGYNIYHNFPNGSFDFLAFTTLTNYIDEDGVFDTHCYKVTAIYDDGESDPTDEVCVLFTGNNTTFDQNLSIFPNPASDVVNIKSDIQIKNVKVYNYSGQIIRNEKADTKFYQINTSQFEAGIYFLSIETKEGVVSERVVVQ